MSFCFTRVHFFFGADERLSFPAPLPANLLRGALGSVLRSRPEDYLRLFAPTSPGGPSGLVQRPRPFVFRAAHLAGATIEASGDFWFHVHVFDTDLVELLINAFAEVANEGLGAERSRVKLLSFHRERVEMPLEPGQTAAQATVEFVTPTELKHNGVLVKDPAFPILVSLIGTRLINLGGSHLDALPPAWLDTANEVNIACSDLRHVAATRFSSRTGQEHPLGGFVGTVTYEGDLTRFIPYLQAAQHTGVGRQTTWGKGELRLRL